MLFSWEISGVWGLDQTALEFLPQVRKLDDYFAARH
jgi:hypothetical protein